MEAIRNYITGAIAELHQVRWPTRQQAIRLSIIVIGFTAAASVGFGATDFVLSEVGEFLLSFVV